MRHILVFLPLVLISLSCSDSGTGPEVRRFNMLLKFGVGARNELNTFSDTFTKDLIVDGTVTTRLVLSQSDFDSIEARFLSINIFNVPDTFVVQHTDTVVVVTPYTTYVLKFTRESRQKVLYWADSLISADIQAANLRRTFDFIRTMVEGKPEYKRLPPARGGYL